MSTVWGFDRHASLDDVVTGFLGSAHEILVNSGGPAFDGDVEAVHRQRAALRSLRARLHLVRTLLRGTPTAHLADEAGWLARTLGAVRDDHVVESVIIAAARLGAMDLGAVDEVLAGRIRLDGLHRVAMLEALGSERYETFIDELGASAAAPPYRRRVERDQPARSLLVGLVERRWEAIRAAVDADAEVGTDRARHHARRRLKEVRYLAELLQPLIGRPAHRFARIAASMTDLLGEQHDAAVAAEWLASAGPQMSSGPAGFVSGQLEAQLRSRAVDLAAQWTDRWQAESRRPRFANWLR